MPIAGGYDVQLGSNKFVLDMKEEKPYSFFLRQKQQSGDRQIFSPDDAKMASSDELLAWDITDWSGGEGARRWYKEDPTVYDYATGLNGRIRGQITTRPDRDSVSVSTDDQRKKCYLAAGAGRLWFAQGQTLRYSTDAGATWTNASSTLNLAANYVVTAVAGDFEALYVFAATTANRIVRKISFPAGVLTGADVVAAHAATAPWIGATIMGGLLYGWTGRKLYEFDLTATLPLTLDKNYRKVFDTTNELDYSNFGGSSAGSWWGECVASENRVYCHVGMEGQTSVYEFDGTAGLEVWRMDQGFTGKSMVVQGGLLYVNGHWSGESSPTGGFGCSYILVLDGLVPDFLGWYRKADQENFQMQEACNSYGKQIMTAAAKNGKVFIYDASFDSISMLDDLALGSNDKIGAMLTYGTKRLVLVYSPGAGAAGTAVTLYRYSSDEPNDREDTGSITELFESGAFDYDRPHDTKTLQSVYVTFEPLVTNQRIIVEYNHDNQGWTTLGTVTSATTGSSTGRVVLTASTGANDLKFFREEIRVTLDNNSTGGVKPPILYAVCPVAKAMSKEKVWDLYIRVRDEHQDRGRGRSRGSKAEILRDYLRNLFDLQKPFTFLDGARYASKPNYYSTHVVTLEVLEDVIDTPREGEDARAEGTMFVRLVEVAS